MITAQRAVTVLWMPSYSTDPHPVCSVTNHLTELFCTLTPISAFAHHNRTLLPAFHLDQLSWLVIRGVRYTPMCQTPSYLSTRRSAPAEGTSGTCCPRQIYPWIRETHPRRLQVCPRTLDEPLYYQPDFREASFRMLGVLYAIRRPEDMVEHGENQGHHLTMARK